MRSHSATDAGGRHRKRLQSTATLWLNAKLTPNCLASHGLRCPSDHGGFRIMSPFSSLGPSSSWRPPEPLGLSSVSGPLKNLSEACSYPLKSTSPGESSRIMESIPFQPRHSPWWLNPSSPSPLPRCSQGRLSGCGHGQGGCRKEDMQV